MSSVQDFPQVFSLSNKIAWVTGGGSGLGLEITRCMVKAGATVIITGRREDVLLDARQAMGFRVHAFVHDVDELSTHAQMVEKIEQEVGPIDILVNNAGINQKKPALEVSEAEFDRILHTNLKGLFSLTQACGKGMVARRSGVILMISSMAAYYGIDRVPAYTASKAAVEGIVKALAEEWSPHNLRVNAIAPGFMDTPMFRKAMDADPSRREKAFDRTPLQRFGQPEDVGWAAVFLASEAARYITGVSLRVDGGNAIGF